MPQNTWTLANWIRFSFGYFFSKFTVLWEVRRPRFKFFIFEMRYSFANFLNTLRPGTLNGVLYYGPEKLETRQGIFRIRSGSHDAAIVSPAFEREDIQYLLAKLDVELAAGQSVGFVDVGANIGNFAVRAALHAGMRPLRTWAFEPIPDNLEVLRENLKLNAISSVEVFPIALSDANGKATMNFSAEHPGDSHLGAANSARGKSYEIETRRGDEVLLNLPAILFVKMDVEGHERSVLEGMRKCVGTSERCWLCIEDIFEREALYDFLLKMGYRFVTKLSPYNSWWLFEPRRN